MDSPYQMIFSVKTYFIKDNPCFLLNVIGEIAAMNIRHKKFVESIRIIIDVEEKPSKSILPGSNEDLDEDSFDLQAELERRFEEIFGPLDDN